MAGFLYYLPGVEMLTLEQARQRGFSYAMEGRDIHARQVARGPEGQGQGVVFADPDRVPQGRIGFYPERQTWRRIPQSDGWIGLDKEQPPEPKDLARAKQLSGHWVELADGRQWLAPVARGQADVEGDLQWYCALPREITVSDEGAWTRGEVLPRYAELWQRALAFWDVFRAELMEDDTQPAAGDDDQLNDLSLFALSLNYTIGKAELRLLGLFDLAARSRVLAALVDWPTMEAWLKKKHPVTGGG